MLGAPSAPNARQRLQLERLHCYFGDKYPLKQHHPADGAYGDKAKQRKHINRAVFVHGAKYTPEQVHLHRAQRCDRCQRLYMKINMHKPKHCGDAHAAILEFKRQQRRSTATRPTTQMPQTSNAARTT